MGNILSQTPNTAIKEQLTKILKETLPTEVKSDDTQTVDHNLTEAKHTDTQTVDHNLTEAKHTDIQTVDHNLTEAKHGSNYSVDHRDAGKYIIFVDSEFIMHCYNRQIITHGQNIAIDKKFVCYNADDPEDILYAEIHPNCVWYSYVLIDADSICSSLNLNTTGVFYVKEMFVGNFKPIQEYWRMTNEIFGLRIITNEIENYKNKHKLHLIPIKSRTIELCVASICDHATNYQFVPDEHKTNILNSLFLMYHQPTSEITYLELIPEETRNEQLCVLAVRLYSKNILYVPARLQTKEMWRIAIEVGAYISQIPESILDEELCILYVETGQSDELADIPLQLRTKRVCEASFEHHKYSCDYDRSYIPKDILEELLKENPCFRKN